MADSLGSDAARISEALRRIKPASCIAVCGDLETPVAMGPTKGRYDRAARSILSLRAEEVRCLDSTGAIVDTLQLVDEPTDPSATPKPGAKVDEVRALVQVALDASDKACARQVAAFEATLNAAVDIMRAASDRAAALETLLVQNMAERTRELEETRKVIELAAQSAADGQGDELMKQLIDIGKMRMLSGGGGAKSNGSTTTTPPEAPTNTPKG